MEFIISLAHFCDLHGPTSILCTQALPVSCLQCSTSLSHSQRDELHREVDLDEPLIPRSPHGSRRRQRGEAHSRKTSRSDQYQASSPTSQFSFPNTANYDSRFRSSGPILSSTSIETTCAVASPPNSPVQFEGAIEGAYPGSLGSLDSLGGHDAARRYSGLRPGPGANATSADTCPNCSMSLPDSVSRQLPDAAPGSLSKGWKYNGASPVLRSREAVIGSPSLEDRANSDDSGEDDRDTTTNTSFSSSSSHAFNPTTATTTTPFSTPNLSRSSTVSSTAMSASPPSQHPHTITYLTTRLPQTLLAHSLLRRSTIRTLSCETLPRPHSSGPLMFGDAQAGYTIAHAFRLADPAARGRTRRYAFVAWAGRDQRRATRAYRDVLTTFANMAATIAEMVEQRRDREFESEPDPDTLASLSTPSSSSTTAAAAAAASPRRATPVASFLSGRTLDPDGCPRGREADARRAKGLAELVGRDDVFVELHAVFVRLLARLGRALGGSPTSAATATPSTASTASPSASATAAAAAGAGAGAGAGATPTTFITPPPGLRPVEIPSYTIDASPFDSTPPPPSSLSSSSIHHHFAPSAVHQRHHMPPSGLGLGVQAASSSSSPPSKSSSRRNLEPDMRSEVTA
ncbi:MAG: hypothetical protein M1825_003498 [Sarcosagium campestre]|nr:MAG: hypothetical protein M1825_003498 [Sarcosagium campestre]